MGKHTWPVTVVAVTAKLADTVEPPPPPLPPLPFEPVWMATALRAGTVAVKEPPETVTLYI